jgi:hypothetical protein
MPVQGGFALVGVWGQSPQVFLGTAGAPRPSFTTGPRRANIFAALLSPN